VRVFAAVFLVCSVAPVWAAPDDATVIVRRSLELHQHNNEIAKDYTYRQQSVVTQYDSRRRAKRTDSTTHEVISLYGRPYTRLVEKNGSPLSVGDERKQEERMRKEMERRRKAAEQGDSRERREYEREQAERRRMIADIIRAYSFTLTGEDILSGSPAYVIQAEPRPDYKPHDRATGILPKVRGRLWIDKTDYQWVRVEAQVIDTISIGLFLARLGPGSSLYFEQRRVNGELWLPSQARIMLDGRIALLKKLREDVVINFSDYRKFQADSRVISTGVEPAGK
jgi:hypothetical protein